MATTKKLKAISGQFMFIVTAALFLLLPSPGSANERIRTLGNDSLGETINVFRTRYEGATCTRTIIVTAQGAAESPNKSDVDCCLNDRESASKVSSFQIVILDDDCAVRAKFTKNRLTNISYIVDVRSVEIVLDSFEKLYGPPTQMMGDSKDTSKLAYVSWWQGDAILTIVLCRLGKEVSPKDSTHPNGEPWLQVVTIALWETP